MKRPWERERVEAAPRRRLPAAAFARAARRVRRHRRAAHHRGVRHHGIRAARVLEPRESRGADDRVADDVRARGRRGGVRRGANVPSVSGAFSLSSHHTGPRTTPFACWTPIL